MSQGEQTLKPASARSKKKLAAANSAASVASLDSVATLQAAGGQSVGGPTLSDLDPDFVDASLIDDRLVADDDGDFKALCDSIALRGQKTPILVRPHPEIIGRFQVAYGHRRLLAAKVLARRVQAIIRPMSDAELVVAQGIENAQRKNLSFIERATFARKLEDAGFDRA